MRIRTDDRRLPQPRFPLAALGLVAVLAVAACGGSAAAAPQGGAPETQAPAGAPATEVPMTEATEAPVAEPGLTTTLTACEAITAEDVMAILGKEAEPIPSDSSANGITKCRYDGVGLNITLDAGTGEARYRAAEKSYKEITPVAGVGDAAFYSTKEKALVVKVNGTALFIHLRFAGDAVDLSSQLAKAAAARL